MIKIEWFLCWAAYQTVLLLPHDWRLTSALLPYAGLYAYTDGGFPEYRATRTGFCTMSMDDYDTLSADLNAALVEALDGGASQ